MPESRLADVPGFGQTAAEWGATTAFVSPAGPWGLPLPATDWPRVRTRRSRKAHTAMGKFERCMAKCQEQAENDEAELAACLTQFKEEFAADTTSSAQAETEDQVDGEKEKQQPYKDIANELVNHSFHVFQARKDAYDQEKIAFDTKFKDMMRAQSLLTAATEHTAALLDRYSAFSES